MKPAPFDFVAATSSGEAVALLAGTDGARLIAGGQSLMPGLARRTVRPTLLVDVNGVGLDHVDVASGGGAMSIGALVRQRRLARDPDIASACPLLAEAAGLVGHAATRNLGTLGGSLAHADPRAELPAVLVALGGSVTVESPGGRRTIAAADLYADAYRTTLARDELLVEVGVPAWVTGDGWGGAFCEWTPRARDFAVTGVAVVVRCVDGVVVAVRAAACGISGAPLDLSEALTTLLAAGRPDESRLRGIAASVTAMCAGQGVPSGDGFDRADRAELAGLLAARAVWRALDRARVVDGVAA